MVNCKDCKWVSVKDMEDMGVDPPFYYRSYICHFNPECIEVGQNNYCSHGEPKEAKNGSN